MLQPTPKRRMAVPPVPLSTRPQPMAAESTGLKPRQAPVYGADVAPGARQVMGASSRSQPALGSSDDYEFKERARQYKDNGAPDVSLSTDEEKRPYYNPLTKRLNISPYHGKSVQEEYLSELSHSRQHNKGGLLNLAVGAAKGAMLPDSDQAGGRYDTPGTMEYNAHKEIEPVLIKQWNEASDKGMKQAEKRQQKQSALFTQPAAERGFTPTFEPPMKKRMSAIPAPNKYADGAKNMAAATPKKKLLTGSYAASTTGQLQGKSSNQSQADLDMMRNSGANAGAALRQAAPVGNQSYDSFQRTRKSPQGQADKAAYEASNKLGRLTDADYQQRRFDEGTGQVRKMAQASPGSSVFSGAPLDAAYADQRDRAVRLGNYADTGSSAATAASLADRSAKMDTQTGYTAPGVAMSAAAKDMGSSTPMKKKMDASLATYADGSKKIKASRMAQDEAANERAEPSRMPIPTVTAPDMAADPDTDGSLMARKMRATPKELPADRDAGPKKATDYKEAAAVLRSDKALMAEYHAGVASGKAFSMNIGGKTFKYAASAQGQGNDDIKRGRAQDAADDAALAPRTQTETDNAWRKYAGKEDPKKAAPAKSITAAPAQAPKAAAEAIEPGSTEETFAQYGTPARRSPSGQLTKMDVNDKQVQYYPNGRMLHHDGTTSKINPLPTSAEIKKRKMAAR